MSIMKDTAISVRSVCNFANYLDAHGICDDFMTARTDMQPLDFLRILTEDLEIEHKLFDTNGNPNYSIFRKVIFNGTADATDQIIASAFALENNEYVPFSNILMRVFVRMLLSITEKQTKKKSPNYRTAIRGKPLVSCIIFAINSFDTLDKALKFVTIMNESYLDANETIWDAISKDMKKSLGYKSIDEFSADVHIEEHFAAAFKMPLVYDCSDDEIIGTYACKNLATVHFLTTFEKLGLA